MVIDRIRGWAFDDVVDVVRMMFWYIGERTGERKNGDFEII